VALCAAVSIAAAAAALLPAGAETLEDALVMAYRGNPTLMAKRAELRATDEGVARARSGFRPTIVGDGSVGHSELDLEGAAGSESSQSFNPSDVSLSVVQPLFTGGRTPAEIRAAEDLVRAGRADLQVTEQQVMLDSVTAYLDVLQNEKEVELNINNERVLGEQLEATRNRFEVGDVTRTDVAQAEARLAQAQSDRVAAEGNLIAARSAYREVIGSLPGTLELPEPAPRLPESESAALALAAEANPSIILAEYLERSARNQIDVAGSALWPKVQLRGELGQSNEPSVFFEEESRAVIRAEVSVPLYQSGSEYAEIRRSKQIAGQRRLELDAARRSVFDQVTQAWEALTTARARGIALDAQIEAARAALDGVQQEADVGLRTTLDVLDAEQELFTAQVDRVRARRDEYVAGFQLKSTVGELTAERLSLPVERYDENEYYEKVNEKWIGIEVDGE
jgi:TolC family type I secretion outer membrane protein